MMFKLLRWLADPYYISEVLWPASIILGVEVYVWILLYFGIAGS